MDTDTGQAQGLTPQEATPGQARPGEAAPREHTPGARPITAPPRKRRSLLSTLLWAGVFILVVALIVWFASTRGSGSSAAGPGGGHGRGGRGGAGGMATTVSVAQVARADVPIYLNQLGTVTPLATVTVTSQVSGFLQSLGFQEGQLVHKGQFLAQIDPRPYQAALLQAEGTLARDQAALAQARLDLKRYRLLLSQDSIASQTVDQQAATVLQDEGTVKTDEGTIAADRPQHRLRPRHLAGDRTGGSAPDRRRQLRLHRLQHHADQFADQLGHRDGDPTDAHRRAVHPARGQPAAGPGADAHRRQPARGGL